MPNIVTKRHDWAAQNEGADNGASAVTKIGVAGAHHIITSISGGMGGTAAGTATFLRLFDGPGTIIWQMKFLTLANDSKQITLGGLSIKISKGSDVSILFSVASGAGVSQTVAMTGYLEKDVVQETG